MMSSTVSIPIDSLCVSVCVSVCVCVCVCECVRKIEYCRYIEHARLRVREER